jgi:hypothetical protein
MGKKTGSGMSNPNYFSESLTNFLCGSGMEKIRIRDIHPGSATLNVALRNAHPVVAGPEDRAEALHSFGVVNLAGPAHVCSEYPHRLVVAPGHDFPACGMV